MSRNIFTMFLFLLFENNVKIMKKYKIKKGNHYSFPLFRAKFELLKDNVVQFARVRVRFNKTNIYEFKDNHNKQFDTNKLFGYSQGHHHNNSVRVGWYWNTNDEHIHLCYYAYENGKNLVNGLWKDVCAIEIDKIYEVLLDTIRDTYNKSDIIDSMRVYDFDERLKHKHRIASYYHVRKNVETKHKIGYYMTPYFGGTMKCPHDMTIEMEWL